MTRIVSLLVACIFLVACGSKKAQAPPATTTAVAPTTSVATTTTAGPGALQAEVAATSAGDIPDNQVFVIYPGKPFTIKYPEGWTQSGGGDNVTFRDKNDIVRVVIVPGNAPTVSSVQHELANLKGATASGTPTTLTLDGTNAVKVTYRATSAPNPVTGKRVTLAVDRYVLAKNGKRVIVDLGSPVGVDNVDAYRLMIQSLRLK